MSVNARILFAGLAWAFVQVPAVPAAPDAFEIDDSRIQAGAIAVSEIQSHNIHVPNDEDWVRFYATTGFPYVIEATQTSTNSDLQLELFYAQPDGVLTNVELLLFGDFEDGIYDDAGKGTDEIEEILDLDFGTYTALQAGVYYLRVSNADTNCWGDGSEYDLQIRIPAGGGTLSIQAVHLLTGAPLPFGTFATLNSGASNVSFNGGYSATFNNVEPAGVHHH